MLPPSWQQSLAFHCRREPKLHLYITRSRTGHGNIRAASPIRCADSRGTPHQSRPLKQAFIEDQKCVLIPNDDVMKRCISISKTPLAKGRLQGNESALFITASAAANNFGVISNHQSIIHTTVGDLCNAYGIPFLSADQYFAEL